MMRFICDVMLGKLAKKLRMLGFDTSYHNNITIEKLIAAALKENRIVLTRKTALTTSNKAILVLLILDNNPKNQLRQTVSRFKINKGMINHFSRCISCNKELSPLERDLVEGKVADYVFNTTDSFKTCVSCGKIYWPGTHLQNMERLINNIFI
jgi:uncharacterized protein with PIN domain